MWQSVKISNVFNVLTLKQIFCKTKTFFKNLEYHFLVETTEIENTSFPFKTAPPSEKDVNGFKNTGRVSSYFFVLTVKKKLGNSGKSQDYLVSCPTVNVWHIYLDIKPKSQ